MFDEAEDPRRASPRVKCNWAVKCVTEQKKTFSSRAMNVSQGGVQIVAPVAFKKGDRLYMEVSGYLKGTTHVIKVVGVVVYFAVSGSGEMQIGLKFVSNLPIADSKFLQKYTKAMLNG